MRAPLPALLLLIVLALPVPAAAKLASEPKAPGEALAAAGKAGDAARGKGIVASGTPVDAPDWAGWSALDWAALLLETEIAAYLIAEGADIEHLAPGGRSSGRPLTLAAKKYRGEAMVGLLLERGAEGDGTDLLGRTALMRAAEHGWLPTVELLLAHGANPNRATPGPKHHTALVLARDHGHHEVARRLVAAGAK